MMDETEDESAEYSWGNEDDSKDATENLTTPLKI